MAWRITGQLKSWSKKCTQLQAIYSINHYDHHHKHRWPKPPPLSGNSNWGSILPQNPPTAYRSAHINTNAQMHHCTSDMQCTQNYLSIVCVLKTFGYCTGLVSLVSPVHILHFRHYFIIETLSIFISEFWHVPTMMGFCHGRNMLGNRHDHEDYGGFLFSHLAVPNWHWPHN